MDKEAEKATYQELLEEMEKIDSHIRGQLAGYVLSSWWPMGVVRKFIAGALLVIGGLGLFSSWWFVILILLSLAFSPRVVGEIAFVLGRMFGN